MFSTQYTTQNGKHTRESILSQCESHSYNSSLSEYKSLSFHIHINIDPNRNQIIPNLLRTKLLIASKHISRHALVIMKKRTKMHVIVWLHESKQSIQRLALPHQSPKLARHEQFDLHLEVHRCWGLSAPFQWLFLLQDDPRTIIGNPCQWLANWLTHSFLICSEYVHSVLKSNCFRNY